jgi:predicted RecA/RadA family phage recombinase
MLNEIRNDRPADARFYPCPSTVLSGDPVLIGTLPAVALDSYNSNSGGTVFRFAGTCEFTVIAATVVSPVTGSAAKPGDKIYATGTLDATTNVTTGLTLSKASGGTLFGSYDGAGITSGSTDTAARVKLRETV